eukprot:836099_1
MSLQSLALLIPNAAPKHPTPKHDPNIVNPKVSPPESDIVFLINRDDGAGVGANVLSPPYPVPHDCSASANGTYAPSHIGVQTVRLQRHSPISALWIGNRTKKAFSDSIQIVPQADMDSANDDDVEVLDEVIINKE